MNTFRHDDEQRRHWVQDKLTKKKTVKQICKEAQISRATLYNWLDEFKAQKKAVGNEQPVPIFLGLAAIQENAEEQHIVVPIETSSHLPEIKTLPVHHAGTKHRMLLAALGKVDADKSIARKLAATLVKRFTLSVAQACDITGIDETIYGYKPRKPEVDDRLVQQSIVQLLAHEPTANFDECCDKLRKANPGWTRKQIKRVYREGRLYLKRQRSRSGKNGAAPFTDYATKPHRPGACWNVGIVKQDNGYLLFILDDADALVLNTNYITEQPTSEQMIAFLNRAEAENGKPRRLRVPDKEPFNIREITGWAHIHKLSVLRLSMSKAENELEVQGMEESVREQVKDLKESAV